MKDQNERCTVGDCDALALYPNGLCRHHADEAEARFRAAVSQSSTWVQHVTRTEARIEADKRERAVLAAAMAAADAWGALCAKMTRDPFMPRATRAALDTLSAAVAELRKVRP